MSLDLSIPYLKFPQPELSDQAAAEIAQFIQELEMLFQFHYGKQVRRYHDQQRYFYEPDQPFNDDPSPF